MISGCKVCRKISKRSYIKSLRDKKRKTLVLGEAVTKTRKLRYNRVPFCEDAKKKKKSTPQTQ